MSVCPPLWSMFVFGSCVRVVVCLGLNPITRPKPLFLGSISVLHARVPSSRALSVGRSIFFSFYVRCLCVLCIFFFLRALSVCMCDFISFFSIIQCKRAACSQCISHIPCQCISHITLFISALWYMVLIT